MSDLEHRTRTGVVLVTGASSGIGRATAQRLFADGYRVIGTSRRPASETADGFEMIPLDVMSDESVMECVRRVAKRCGKVDVLINNVGTGILGAAEESSADQVKALFDINFFGAVRMTNAVLPFMREKRSGKILFMSSSGGVASIPFASYYCATKHALEAYVESLRIEIEDFGIAAVLIAPGPVGTTAGEKAMRPDRALADYRPRRDVASENFIRSIREGMDPAKVAETIHSVIRERHPHLRYTVGSQSFAVSFLKRVLPARIFEASVRHASGS